MRRLRFLAGAVVAGAALVTGLSPSGLTAPQQPGTVTVAAGDTLEELALRYRVNLQALIALNGIGDPTLLQIGQVLKLPPAAAPSIRTPSAAAAIPPPPEGSGSDAAAALLLSPAERRDRAELDLREQSGQARWRWFNGTAVDWSGWRLHPGGVRITLVKPAIADVGITKALATATRCCSPPESSAGRWSRRSVIPTSSRRSSQDSPNGTPANMAGSRTFSSTVSSGTR